MTRATTFALVAALLLVPAAFASHPSWVLEWKGNVDADRALERISAEYDVSSDHKFERATISVFDNCRGRVRQYTLAVGRSTNREGILGQRDLGRPGVLFTMVYADRHEIARVVQLRPKQRGACPTPVAILDYSSARPTYPAPQGYTVRDAKLQPGDYSATYAGRELLLTEEYTSPRLNPIRLLRNTYFNYSAAKRRYVPYRTELTPPV
ncbi:MAG TPA: hypothetical protein VFL41_10630 [Gaiellaceae bacterium]|nr:hypothetical protein [Gaiellaceae bacterium]